MKMLKRVSDGCNFAWYQRYFIGILSKVNEACWLHHCWHSGSHISFHPFIWLEQKGEKREGEIKVAFFMIKIRMSWLLQNSEIGEASFHMMVTTYLEGSVLSYQLYSVTHSFIY